MHAIGYVRVSGISQIDKGGFRRQDDAISKWCRDNDFEYLACYPEYGVTGDSDLTNRVALTSIQLEMDPHYAKVKSWACPKVLVVEDHTRMARGLCAGLSILADVRKLGLRVIIAVTGQPWTVDETSPEAVAMWGVQQVFAQYEKSKQLARMSAGKITAALLGYDVNGMKKYGQAPNPKKGVTMKCLERASREQVFINELRNLAKKHNRVKIVQIINEAGFRTRQKTRWTVHTLRTLMRRHCIKCAVRLPPGPPKGYINPRRVAA